MKKILFNDNFLLTQAVLDGRKTQTRQLLTLTLHKEIDEGNNLIEVHPSKVFFENGKWKFEYDGYVFLLPKENYPKYDVGEVVAVAQSYKDLDAFYNAAFNRKHSVHGMTLDMLDCVPDEEIKKWFEFRELFAKKASWKNKMFVKAELMPHQIRITDVRVERLQDISEEDAIAEGITYAGLFYEDYGEPMFIIEGCKQTFGAARDAYAWLINKISGKETWQSNPYVFVYDFELIK